MISTPSSSDDSKTRPLVVLIEDDPLVRFGQTVPLRDWGYRMIAEAPLKAVKAALPGGADEIAAIITDFHLGDVESGALRPSSLAHGAGLRPGIGGQR